MSKKHHYKININWTGNLGTGTSTYSGYKRDHEITNKGKPVIPASADPAFRGDGARYNPEELLVASLSSCHMLWYLHLCAENKVVVTAYSDKPTGIMTETENGSGVFESITLHPRISVSDPLMIDKANELHHEAHRMCYIANSCKFPVYCEPCDIGQPLRND